MKLHSLSLYCRCPSWAAWIEIAAGFTKLTGFMLVAALRGQRGLKYTRKRSLPASKVRRCPSWAAWIEIQKKIKKELLEAVAALRGQRGLKCLTQNRTR